jgi:hypothetical protein
VSCEQQHVCATCSERRYDDAYHVQAIVEILAKALGLHLELQILARRGNQPAVERYLAVIAHWANRAFLERAQQLGLQGERQLANFIEQEGAAACLDH